MCGVSSAGGAGSSNVTVFGVSWCFYLGFRLCFRDLHVQAVRRERHQGNAPFADHGGESTLGVGTRRMREFAADIRRLSFGQNPPLIS